jgi:hypothetical protein
VYSLQWLYDNYPRGELSWAVLASKLIQIDMLVGLEEELIQTMQLVKQSGFDWYGSVLNCLLNDLLNNLKL